MFDPERLGHRSDRLLPLITRLGTRPRSQAAPKN